MKRSLAEIIGWTIRAGGEEVGTCKDALFDDEKWTLRYLDIDTGHWLPGRRVLLSPVALERIEQSTEEIHFNLTPEQIEEAPGLEENAPVSRQWERMYYSYYGWPHYAAGTYIWGFTSYPQDVAAQGAHFEAPRIEGDPHLRSFYEVRGYRVQTQDDSFGSVDDLLFDEETWSIRYFVLDTIKWFPSKKVLIPPEWIQTVDWETSSIHTGLAKDVIKNAPGYDPKKSVDINFESLIYDYYSSPHSLADKKPAS